MYAKVAYDTLMEKEKQAISKQKQPRMTLGSSPLIIEIENPSEGMSVEVDNPFDNIDVQIVDQKEGTRTLTPVKTSGTGVSNLDRSRSRIYRHKMYQAI